jgi:hypothetical protein
MKIIHNVVIVFFATLILISTGLQAQNLTWRLTDPHISGNNLVFDVEVKSDQASVLYSAQMNLVFNEDVFTDTWSRTRIGISAQQNTAGDDNHYGISFGLTGTTMNVGLTHSLDNSFVFTPNQYEKYVRVTIGISDAAILSNMMFDLSVMSGQNFTALGTPYDSSSADGDFSNLYLGRIHSAAGSGWTQHGGTVSWGVAENTSIWDGSATIDVADAKMANLHIHEDIATEALAGLYIAPSAGLTVTGTLSQDVVTKNSGKNGSKEPLEIAKWDFEDTGQTALPYTADDGIAANNGEAEFTSNAVNFMGYFTFIDHSIPNWDRAPFANGWQGGLPSVARHWQIEFSSSGYENLKLSSKQWSDLDNVFLAGVGPNEFKVQWSSNGSDWADVPGGTITVGNDGVIGTISDLTLPTNLNDQSTAYIRWLNSSGANNGVSAIDDIIITGEPLPTYEGLVIGADETGSGSLIANTEVTATVQQYVPESTFDNWTTDPKSPANWYFIAPYATIPVADFTNNGTAGSDGTFILYRWNEDTDTWENFEAGGFTNLDHGVGYIYAPKEAGTVSYTATLSATDFNATSLTRTGTGGSGGEGTEAWSYDPGWNLIGNPYSSGLNTGSSAGWESSSGDVTLTPQVHAGGGYQPASSLAPGQAFFVQVITGTSGSLNIPASARAHVGTVTTTKNNNNSNNISLMASPVEGKTWQQSVIRYRPDAVEGFDYRYDSQFRDGDSPKLYSMMGDTRMLVQAISHIDEETVVPFQFIKNHEGNEFQIAATETIEYTEAWLVDLLAQKEHQLVAGGEPYVFTSLEGDDPDRFLLKFSNVTVDTDDITAEPSINAWVYNNILHVHTPYEGKVTLYDIQGRQLQSFSLEQGEHSFHLNHPAGVYLIRMQSNNTVETQRVIIR